MDKKKVAMMMTVTNNNIKMDTLLFTHTNT